MTWRNITYKDKKCTNVVLDNVSGSAKAGTLSAIFGITGSGKTNLLKILTGRIKVGKGRSLEGTVLVNGQKRDKSWRFKVAFAEDNNIAFSDLTVDEILQIHADLNLGSSYSYAEKRSIIDYVIYRLDLGYIRYSRVGTKTKTGLNNGELKLISIACLILELPQVAILDEPNSGLDSTRSLFAFQFLREICEKTGMTAIASIHRPRRETWAAFDRVSILSKHQLIFFGTPKACEEYFGSEFKIDYPEFHNPSDLILDFLKYKQSKGEDIPIKTSFLETGTGTEVYRPLLEDKTGEVNHHWKNSFWREFAILHYRYVLIYYRDRRTLIADLAQTIVLMILISFAYFQLGNDEDGVTGTISLFYFISVSLLATVGMPLWTIFSIDRPFLLRERASGSYRMFSCYLAKFIAVLPVSILLWLLFTIPIYFITGLSMPFTKFLTYMAITFALRIVAVTLGLMISSMAKSIYVSLILGPFFIVMFVLFGDLKAESDDMTWILLWIRYLSPLYYTVQALMQNEFQGNTYLSDIDSTQTVDSDYYLDKYDFQQIGIWYCFIALVGFSFLYFILGFISLKLTTRTKQHII